MSGWWDAFVEVVGESSGLLLLALAGWVLFKWDQRRTQWR